MQTQLLLAGLLAVVVGLVHSVLGEILIFRHLRNGGVIPTAGHSVLKERHVRILWATWHIVTIFGWATAAMLLVISARPGELAAKAILVKIIVLAMAASAALVLVATRGRHPGWLGLLGVAALAWLGLAGL